MSDITLDSGGILDCRTASCMQHLVWQHVVRLHMML
jgi:hypothetical protein